MTLMLVIFALIFFLPLIPLLNRLPHVLKVYRLIWWDWYRHHAADYARARARP